eukprot:485319-Prorocentrum_minimum.AAC.10
MPDVTVVTLPIDNHPSFRSIKKNWFKFDLEDNNEMPFDTRDILRRNLFRFFPTYFLVPKFDRTKVLHWILSFAGKFAQELCSDDHFGANSGYLIRSGHRSKFLSKFLRENNLRER